LFAAVIVILGVLVHVPGGAGYVIYFHTFGDWTVVCSKDEPTDRKSCTLSAPPPAIDLSNKRSHLTVAEHGNGTVTVFIRVGGEIEAGHPVYLRVDENPFHQVRPNRFGETGWTGEAAIAIRDQLENGQRMVLRSFPEGTGKPRDEMLSLAGFAEALQTYRANLRAYGVLGSPR
jgi:invasion protein IalB